MQGNLRNGKSFGPKSRTDSWASHHESIVRSDDHAALHLATQRAQARFYETIGWAAVGLVATAALAVMAMIVIYICHLAADGRIDVVVDAALAFLAGSAVTLSIEHLAARKSGRI